MRRANPKQRLVDCEAAHFGVGQDLLEDSERQLGLAGRTCREGGDVILDVGGPQGIQSGASEWPEMRQDVADAVGG